MNLKPLIICAVVFVLASVSPLGLGVANAVPILQIYLEGGTYNTTTESWELTPPGSSGGEPFRLWTIGNVAAKGTISDVRLSVAYAEEFAETLQISLTPTLVGGIGVYNGVVDPAPSPAIPVLQMSVRTSLNLDPLVAEPFDNGLVDNWSTPVLSDGKMLPSHDIFGFGTVWKELYLGDFDLTDSAVGDFIGSFPEIFDTTGQINAYDVSVTGGSGATVHFDLYNHVQSADKAVFAPFSHDGVDGDVNIIPEPSSLVVWSLFCILGIAVGRWRRRKAS